MKMARVGKNVFEVASLESAQKIILTPEKGYKTEERWQVETPEHAALIKGLTASDATVLDFGIGIGRIAKELLLGTRNLNIVGVDASRTMIRLCREYMPQYVHNRLTLYASDEISRIPDKSVDLIYAIYVLQHVEARILEKTIDELFRILKPSGKFYVFNLFKRSAIDKNGKFYDDKIDLLSILGVRFGEAEDLNLNSPYMQSFLEDHFSKLFTKQV
ncbi:class I SAM-dependent methyltransferase [Candidatus Giovannonibacteria bacterium]|nr:class I SAM-dependent methyltransferase [Candidatus Giovannonibacteria bacterium]